MLILSRTTLSRPYHTPPYITSPACCPTSPPTERAVRASLRDTNTVQDTSERVKLLPEDEDKDIYEDRQLYGILDTNIVGIRYYPSRAVVGEYVLVRRELGNCYDSNAIRIDNLRRQRMGHLARDVAARLAPLMDSGELIVDGIVTGRKSEFQCRLGPKLFGTVHHPEKWALRAKMLRKQLPVQDLDRAEAVRQKRARTLRRQCVSRSHATGPR